MDKLIKINELSEYQKLVDNFNGSSCISNDFIQMQAANLINQGKLYADIGNSNLFLVVDRGHSYRTYFYLNDLTEFNPLNIPNLTTEVIFRTKMGVPTELISYLKKYGFTEHLTRDQYYGVFESLTPAPLKSDLSIKNAKDLQEVQWAFELFNSVFDKYTGDYISPEQYISLLQSRNIFVAYYGDILLGAIHITLDRNVAWISHVAVCESARGRGVGNALVDFYINKYGTSNKSRFMFWVQQQNITAVNLYRKKGFLPFGKSSLSMIKY